MGSLSTVIRRIVTVGLLIGSASPYILNMIWQVQLGGVVLAILTITYSLTMFLRGAHKNKLEQQSALRQDLSDQNYLE